MQHLVSSAAGSKQETTRINESGMIQRWRFQTNWWEMQAVCEGLCQSIGCKQPMLMSTSNSEELATLVTLRNIWWPCYTLFLHSCHLISTKGLFLSMWLITSEANRQPSLMPAAFMASQNIHRSSVHVVKMHRPSTLRTVVLKCLRYTQRNAFSKYIKATSNILKLS